MLCATPFAGLPVCSDLDKPLPRWRRRVVEMSSESCSRVVLFAMGFWWPRLIGAENYAKGQQMGAIGIFNHVSYLDAFVVVWAFCVSGVTFHFSKHLPVLGYGVRALQNLYLPPDNDKTKQQASMVQLIKERCAWAASNIRCTHVECLRTSLSSQGLLLM